MKKCEVLVVGAGPVGTTCAARLAAMGINVLLIELEKDSTHDLRATTIHASTLEMLDQIDAAAPLIELGLKAPVYQMRERKTGDILAFDLTELADMTAFPFRLQCEQYKLARLMADRLTQLSNVEVHFNSRLVSAHETSGGVIATIERNGALEEVETQFLVGADGAKSVVRKTIGTDFDGFTYEEKFVSMSTAFPIDEVITDLSYVNYISDPEEWLVLLRVPSVWRVLVPADGRFTDEELISDANKDALFTRILGHGNVETTHRTIYRVHQRVAQQFVKGRIMIVGDAAHLNNPLGGFGMNSGIHDGFNVADKLWKILRKDAGHDQLALFERQRQAVTRAFIQSQTIENMQSMGMVEGAILDAKRAKMRSVHADPVARRKYLLRQAMFESLAYEKEVA